MGKEKDEAWDALNRGHYLRTVTTNKALNGKFDTLTRLMGVANSLTCNDG
jgi:hypothetical protein